MVRSTFSLSFRFSGFIPPKAHPNDEQQVDETIEQFEERVLNKRAAQMFLSVKSRLLKADHIMLSEMTHRNNKKQVMVVVLTVRITIITICFV